MSTYEVAKRGMDVALSSLALLVLSPVMAAAAIAVLVSMGRPILFAQTRTGKDERPFPLLKFRTMRTADPGLTLEERHASDAVRLTRTGGLLRATSIDELPSLLNVLRGDMSLVGPRPLLPEYLDRYNSRQRRRHEVLPGVTGWAQVNGRNAVPWEERFEMDVWYVDNRSLALDLRILGRTAIAVLNRHDVRGTDSVTPEPFSPPDHRSDRST